MTLGGHVIFPLSLCPAAVAATLHDTGYKTLARGGLDLRGSPLCLQGACVPKRESGAHTPGPILCVAEIIGQVADP